MGECDYIYFELVVKYFLLLHRTFMLKRCIFDYAIAHLSWTAHSSSIKYLSHNFMWKLEHKLILAVMNHEKNRGYLRDWFFFENLYSLIMMMIIPYLFSLHPMVPQTNGPQELWRGNGVLLRGEGVVWRNAHHLQDHPHHSHLPRRQGWHRETEDPFEEGSATLPVCPGQSKGRTGGLDCLLRWGQEPEGWLRQKLHPKSPHLGGSHVPRINQTSEGEFHFYILYFYLQSFISLLFSIKVC